VAGFKFRLEPVLRQRAEKEARAEQALAVARNEYEKRLCLLEETRQRLETVSLGAGLDEMNVLEEMHLSFYRVSLNRKIKSQEQSVKQAGANVDKKRGAAVTARQEKQMMEKLREKHLYRHLREEAGREQKETDELSLYAHQRKAGAGSDTLYPLRAKPSERR